MSAVEVVEPGLLTSVQDARGRPGWGRYGVPACGAADAFSARLANRLAGNPDDAALLEATLVGPSLRFTGPNVVALAGADLGATLDGRPLPPGSARPARDGARLEFSGARAGARAYVAFSGGIVVPSVLGSAATDLRSGFGGLDGRALRAGDRLELGPAAAQVASRWRDSAPADPEPIRIVPGPHADRFSGDAVAELCAASWTVTPQSDRAGVRLDGPAIRHASPEAAEVPSVGLPIGAIQVPLDGLPIVMLVDRPVTGGYLVAACVIRADIGRIAQLVPGDELRFVGSTMEGARAAILAGEIALDAIERAEGDAGDATWAGALE